MKYSVMAFAVMATLAAGVMAQDEKPAARRPRDANAAPREMTAEQREAMQNRVLERMKETNEEQYKELKALKDKDPEAFKAKMDELRKKRADERAKAQEQQKTN